MGKKDYWRVLFYEKYGETADEAFKVIRSELCKLVDAGAKDDFCELPNVITPK